MLRKILSMLLVVTLVLSFSSLYVLAAPTTQTQDAVRVGEDYSYSRVIYSKDGSEITSLETGNITAKIKVKSATKPAPQLFAVLRYDNGKLAAAGVDTTAPASISTVQEYEATVNVPSTENTKLVTVLWDNAKDMNAICPVSVSTNVAAGLKEVYINGKKMENFESDKTEYSFYLDDPSLTNHPKVTYVPFNNTDKVEVTETTEFPGSTKIKVTPFGGTAKEYTINYTYSQPIYAEKELLFCGADENRWSNNNGVQIASSSAGITTRGLTNVSSTIIDWTDSPVKVDVEIDGKLNNNLFIVVRPQNGTNGINNKVIVNPDGSAITTVDNERTYKSYTKESDGSITRTYYQKSSTTPVKFVPAGSGTEIPLWVGYELNGDGTAGDTGADAFNKSPKNYEMHIAVTNDVALGAEYIPLDLSSAIDAGGTFSFYVGQDAIVDVYSCAVGDAYGVHMYHKNASIQFATEDIKVKANDVLMSSSAKEEYMMLSYNNSLTKKSAFTQNYVPYYELTMAYLDYKGHTAGVDYLYDETAEAFYPFGWVDTLMINNGNFPRGATGLSQVAGGRAKWGYVALSSTGDLVLITSAIVVSSIKNPTTDERLWNDFGTPQQTLKTREQLKQLFVVGAKTQGPIPTTKTWTLNDYTTF